MIPAKFQIVIKKGQNHKSKFDGNFILEFINWIETKLKKGVQGNPFL